MDKKRRVLSLLRVSGDQEIDKTGLPRQTEIISHICAEHNLIVASGDEYRYEGLSGASVDKFPRYMEMLDRLTDSEIVGIVFSDVSRFFRPEYLDQMSLTKPFRVNGKLMFYEDGVLDLRKDRDQKLFNEEAMEAGAYRKRLLKNTLWGRSERRKSGDCKSDPLPKGVKFVPHPRLRNELVVGHFEYTAEAERMKDAFRRVLSGESYSNIARDLDFYSPSQLREYLRSRWWIGEKASYNIRTNSGLRDDGTMYSGYRKKRDQPIIALANGLSQRCETCDVHCQPLISGETFEAVQAILDRTEKTWVRTTVDNSTLPYIGIGVLICNRCGRKLYSKPNKKTHKYYYRCSSFNNGHTPCGAPHIHQADIDNELEVYAFVRMQDKKHVESLSPEVPRVNTSILEKQVTDVEQRLDSLYAKLGDPKWDQARIEQQIESATKQGQELADKLAVVSTPSKAHIDGDAIVRRFRNFGKLSLVEKRDAIRKTFAKVVVDYDDEDGKPFIMRVELRTQSQ